MAPKADGLPHQNRKAFIFAAFPACFIFAAFSTWPLFQHVLLLISETTPNVRSSLPLPPFLSMPHAL
jgi:hypothetical protein